MDRIKTGIFGFDDLIEGGLPKGRCFLVSGGCGTGKTIFSMQYLYNGAIKFNEPGVYVSLDERPELIREDCLRFKWDLRELERSNKLTIIDGSLARLGMPSEEEYSLPSSGLDVDKLLLEIIRNIKRIGAKRVVIDSIASLGFNIEAEEEIRKAVLKISYMLMRSGTTSFVISETNEGENRYGKYGVEEYIVDGIIMLHYMGIGTQSNRTLHIRKMRATKHSEDLHPLEITEKGIIIKKIDEEYKEV